MVMDALADAWASAWEPPDRRSTEQWSREINLQGDYARTGPFSCDQDRYLIWPFDLIDHPAVRMVNLLKAPRTGGSLVGDVFFHSRLKNQPGPFMATFQSDDDAEQHYLTRIEPTLKESNPAALAGLRKKRDLYQFPSLNAYFQGANVNSLQRKSIKWEWNDEVWIWKAGMLQDAWARTEDHKRTCFILNVSQAGDKGTEWETCWNAGRRHNWAVHCVGCGHLQPLDFFAAMLADPEARAGIVWDRDARLPDGRWDIPRAAATTRFRCRKCGHDHADDQRSYDAFNASGEYQLVPGDESRSMVEVSLRWTALVAGDWWRLTKRFLEACDVRDQGSTIPLEKFYRGPASLFWDPAMARQRAMVRTGEFAMEPARAAGYKPEPLPWETIRVMTADYQQGSGNDTRHLIVTCRAWGNTVVNRSRLLWQGRVNTFEELHQVQLALGVRGACVGIDASFEMMEVAAQCAKYGWTALIGDDPDNFPHVRKKGKPVRKPFSPIFTIDPGKGSSAQGRTTAKAMRWSNPSIKNLLWNLRHGLGKHQWELPSDISPDYREGIDSEIKERYFPKGSPVEAFRWKQIRKNNHPWDCECMQVVIAVAAGCLAFDIEEAAPPPADAKPAVSGAAAGAASTPARRGSPPVAPHARDEQLTLLP